MMMTDVKIQIAEEKRIAHKIAKTMTVTVAQEGLLDVIRQRRKER